MQSMIVCGLDEAGRGALAGPLIAAAITINPKSEIRNTKLRDGKLLSPKQREEICEWAKSNAEIYVESISVEEINSGGIQEANIKIFENLVKKVQANRFIIDGNLKIEGAESIIDADATIPEVILAGIVAKVERDKIMRQLHLDFPAYFWQENKGYGTQKHIDAIKRFGACIHHRGVFVRSALRRCNSSS